MGVKRELLTGLGLVVALAGFLTIFEPRLARALATSRGMLLAVAALAAIQGYRVARDRRRTALQVAETGDPETEQDLAVPGDDFDDLLARVRRLHSPYGRTIGNRRDSFVQHRRRIKRRLESAAVATITRKFGCTEAAAREAIEAGTWTEDPYAAAFFTGRLEGVDWRDRLRLRFAAQSQFERRATHAAQAIADLSADDRPELELDLDPSPGVAGA